MDRQTVLIVDDEYPVVQSLIFTLEQEAYRVLYAPLAEQAMRLLELDGNGEPRNRVDLVVLDIGLPDINGFELLKRLRQQVDIPVLFLTARDDEIDKVLGLELGADDYVVKPFSPREVMARIKSILRRYQPIEPVTLRTDDCWVRVDWSKGLAELLGQNLTLTPFELKVLERLLQHPGQICSRQQLLDALWQMETGSLERSIDTHIKSIRAKMRAITDVEMIRTHRGLGYSFRETAP